MVEENDSFFDELEYQEKLENLLNDPDKTPEDIEDLNNLTGNKKEDKSNYTPGYAPGENYNQ